MFGKKPSAPKNAAVRWAVRSLRDAPDEWSFDEYRATHVGGSKIWIANGAWALKVVMPKAGELFGEGKGCRATADQKLLWQAILDAKVARLEADVASYAAGSSRSVEMVKRQNAEAARRKLHDAGTLRYQAERLEQEAAEMAEPPR